MSGAVGTGSRRILIAAVGNPGRGDDGIGALVLGALADRLPGSAATLFDVGGDPVFLVEAWAGFDAVICVDACAPSGAPGRIRRIDPATDALPLAGNRGSSHALGLAEAVALARALSPEAPRVIVYAVEGACFDAGAPVSEAVAAAADPVTERILAEVEALRGGT